MIWLLIFVVELTHSREIQDDANVKRKEQKSWAVVDGCRLDLLKVKQALTMTYVVFLLMNQVQRHFDHVVVAVELKVKQEQVKLNPVNNHEAVDVHVPKGNPV